MTGRINFQENMFVGSVEFKKFQELNSGLIQIIGAMTRNFGFIEMNDAIRIADIDSANKENRTCFKASASGAGTITFHTPSYAISWNQNTSKYNIITWNQNRLIQVPTSYYGKSYYVKISYQEESIEKGTLRVDAQGNVTGTGTEFAELLRGSNDGLTSSRIKLYTYDGISFFLIGTYVVKSVSSDNHIVIVEEGTEAIPDVSKTYYYSVAATLPLGSYVTSDNIFIYDGCKVEFVQASSDAIPNEWLMQIDTESFYVCKIDISANGNVTITDKRFIFEDVEDDTDHIYSKWFRMK